MNKLFLVFLVFILVFTPQKLPYLIRELSGIFAKYHLFKKKLMDFWSENLLQDLILEENIKKAQAADKLYLDKNINIEADK